MAVNKGKLPFVGGNNHIHSDSSMLCFNNRRDLKLNIMQQEDRFDNVDDIRIECKIKLNKINEAVNVTKETGNPIIKPQHSTPGDLTVSNIPPGVSKSENYLLETQYGV